MDEKTRLFKSAWTYAFWLLLTGDQVWNHLRHFHPLGSPLNHVTQFWPVFSQVTNAFGEAFCILVIIFLYRLTTNRLEKAGIFLFGLSFVLSISIALNKLGWLPFVPPFNGAISLLLAIAVMLICAIRLVQVISEGPMDSALHRSEMLRNG